MIRVDIQPKLLTWGRERAGLDAEALSHRFPKLAAWEEGTAKPTLKQLENFAKATVSGSIDVSLHSNLGVLAVLLKHRLGLKLIHYGVTSNLWTA